MTHFWISRCVPSATNETTRAASSLRQCCSESFRSWDTSVLSVLFFLSFSSGLDATGSGADAPDGVAEADAAAGAASGALPNAPKHES